MFLNAPQKTIIERARFIVFKMRAGFVRIVSPECPFLLSGNINQESDCMDAGTKGHRGCVLGTSIMKPKLSFDQLCI